MQLINCLYNKLVLPSTHASQNLKTLLREKILNKEHLDHIYNFPPKHSIFKISPPIMNSTEISPPMMNIIKISPQQVTDL